MRGKKITPWARRRRRTYLIFALVVALVAPPIVWRLGMKVEIRRELAALQAAGIPVTETAHEQWLAAFPQPRTVPEFEALHRVYVAPSYETVDHLRIFASNDDISDLFSVPFPPKLLGAMDEAVDLNGELLAQLRAARNLAEGHCRSTAGASAIVIELCCAAACLKAEAGDGAAAADILLDGLVYLKASSAARWPFLTTLGNSQNLERNLFRALASVAARCAIPEPQLQQIQAMLDAPDWAEQARSLNIARFSLHIGDYHNTPLPEDPIQLLKGTLLGVMDQWFASYLYWEPRRIATIGKGVGEQRIVLDAADGAIYAYRPIGPPMHLNVAFVGLDLIRYHQRHGALPETLDQLELGAARTADFFSEKPLVYKPEDNSFMLYSVGDDLEDNGGSLREDLVFEVRWPTR